MIALMFTMGGEKEGNGSGDVSKAITEQDLENNPELKGKVEVGEEVTFSEPTDEQGNPLPEEEASNKEEITGTDAE